MPLLGVLKRSFSRLFWVGIAKPANTCPMVAIYLTNITQGPLLLPKKRLLADVCWEWFLISGGSFGNMAGYLDTPTG